MDVGEGEGRWRGEEKGRRGDEKGRKGEGKEVKGRRGERES